MPDPNNRALFDTCSSCASTGYQSVTVSTPITLTPTVTIGTPEVSCCADPVTSTEPPSGDIFAATGTFYIYQTLCVALPACSDVTAEAGTPVIAVNSSATPSPSGCAGCNGLTVS